MPTIARAPASKPPATYVYCSTDIEADGPIPGGNSLLSFATAAYTADKKLIATFEANLELAPGAVPDPDTMQWWSTQPEAWAACRTNLETPEGAMRRYVAWVKALPGSPVFVAYPAAYDFMWVYWYCLRFAGESPYKRNALDIRSYISGMTKKPFPKCGKRAMPKAWFDPMPHTHKALDDAIEQGALFINILAENNKEHVAPPPKADSALFGTHIREAVDVLTGAERGARVRR